MLRQALLLPFALGIAANAASAQESANPETAPDGTWLVALRDAAPDAEPQPWALRYTAVQDERPAGSPGAEQDDGQDDEEEKSGFLYGLRKGFEKKPRPLDSPLYFEDPYINTEIRAIYLYHTFPKDTPLGRGDVQVAAIQARIAITDRLQFIATEDGYSWLDTDAFGTDTGWMDLAMGLKFALLVDEDADFILSVGGRYTIPAGNEDVLKGLCREWSAFATAAKGWNDGKTNVIGNVNFRQPFNQADGNTIVSWDAHLNTELWENFVQILEIHGLHYTQNGEQLAVEIGGLDYTNIGSQRAAGNMALWGTFGFRWSIVEQISLGVGYGFPLKPTDNNDIFESRVIANLNFRL
ncbi:MAG: hypothetical protein IPN34_10695 [Planctomycetes bacterium]|nr:hypothetical protein [Planctomycetota bacterium]